MTGTAAYQQYFDALADGYDSYANGDNWTPNVYLADVLAPIAAEATPVRSVVDLGTGTGQTLVVLKDLFPDAELVGVDVSPEMLARAADRVPSALLEVADFTGYVRRLDEGVQLVTAIGCAEFVAELPAALGRLSTRVATGAHLAITIELLVDGLGVDLAQPEEFGGGDSGNTCLHFHWTAADVLGAIPRAQVVASRVFRAYERAGLPVLYELLLIRLPG